MHTRNLLALSLTIATVAGSRPASACTNLLVTKGASADGSTMITYAADSHDLYGYLQYTPPGLHRPGEMRDIYDWDSGKFLGRIKQAPVTYSVVGNMNEFQVSVGETTYGGRKELAGPAGIVDYGSLMYIALERAKTAREAIQVMGELVAEYGYASEGESFSIADPNEVWEMDLIGKGEKAVGAVWVARRVPDGYIGGHANQARIRTVPAQRPRQLPLRQGRHLVRPREGVVLGQRRRVQLHRHVRATELRRRALLRGAGVERVPPRRTVAGAR